MSSLSYIFVSNGVNGLYNRCFHSRKCSGNDTGQNQDNQSENSYIYIYFCMLYHCRVTGAFEQPIYNLKNTCTLYQSDDTRDYSYDDRFRQH